MPRVCIPIIDELVKRGCEVSIASSGSALALLKKEYPLLQFFELMSYKATYSARLPLVISVFLQIPKFLHAISTEQKQIEKIIADHSIELVLSDNRFGCWSKNVPSVFITHQIMIQMPWILKGLQPIINFFNHRFIKRFSHCWIPDISGESSLTGKLSESGTIPVKYIGILSRLKKIPSDVVYDLTIMLSGPEPQRSALEKIILAQLKQSNRKAVLSRGVIEENSKWTQEGEVQLVNYLQSDEIEKIINQSELIVARSGYSTIMDLAKLGRKAVFIPTPGQTEQEYLAQRLMDNEIAFSMNQDEFNLAYAIDQSRGFKGFSNIEFGNELLNQAITEVLEV
jgi:UDP-N-acetylglucosamine transferase subunit ALG13